MIASARESLHERRIAISRSPDLTGLEYIEIETPVKLGRPRLLLHFVPSAPGVNRVAIPPGVTTASIQVGDRSGAPISGIRVAGVLGPTLDAILPVDLSVDADAILAATQGEAYTLSLPGLPAIDPFFRTRPFWLSSHASTERHIGAGAETAQTGDAPEIDYLVKDYASFRRSMLDQLALLAPTWTEQGPADMGMAIVEALAYAADYLSYYQDAASTEAYLGTARQRVSVRRHTRLLGYTLHEGCNARCWAQFTVDGDEPVAVAAGTQLLTGSPMPGEAVLVPSNSRVHVNLLNQGAEVFETVYPTTLRTAHNRLSIYTWGARDWSLPAGSTSASVVGHLPDLQPGDALIFEVMDGDARQRHVVRLVSSPGLTLDPLYGTPITYLEWHADDALPFALPVASSQSGRLLVDETVVYGNVVLADHGRTVAPEWLDPVSGQGLYRPKLRQPGVVFSQPLEAQSLRSASAQALQVQDPRRAVPVVRLVDQREAEEWLPQPDLLRSDRFANDFVVEVDNRSRAQLRFGDGVLGRQPLPGTNFSAVYRVEGGPRGDIDADSLGYIVGDDPRLVGVRNPLPAQPGQAPEPIDDARADAPQLIESPYTCVTEADYSAAAMQHPQVLNAVTRLLWSGTGHVACIYVQRRGGQVVDGVFSAMLEDYLQPRLIAGMSVEIRAPRLVPLWIRLRVEAGADHYRSSISLKLTDLAREYFQPDAFTFGQPVYLSPLVGQVSQVPGVTAVDWLEHGRFQRWGKRAENELETGCIAIGPLEVARAANVPGAPSLGSVEFEVRGGR